MQIVSPGDVINELNRLRDLAEVGAEKIYSAQVALAEAESALDTAYAKSFIRHDGNTVALKEQLAALDTADLRFERDKCRAELDRLKLKMKTISDSMVAVSVIAKQVEMMWRG